MRTLLISPKYSEDVSSLSRILKSKIPPIGLAYIAAALEKAKHKVKIVDAEAEDMGKDDLQQVAKDYNPELVGISVTTWTFRKGKEIARYIKKALPDVPIVVGGPHLASFPVETMEYKEFDFGVIGEGEITICELVDRLENQIDFSDVEGIAYRKDGGVIVTKPREYIKNLDELSIPAWHLLPINKYKDILTRRNHFASIISSRGCPFNCTYCDPDGRFGRWFRTRSPENIMQEMELLYNEYGIHEICFYDDTFTANKERILELCNKLINRDLDIIWECRTRVDCIDEELIKKMSAAGCYRIRFGIESGNEEILKVLKKRITKKQTTQAFKWTKNEGIETLAYFMLGSPEENEETLQNTIDFALELKPDYVLFSPTRTIGQGSELFKWAAEKGYTDADYWKRFVKGENLDPFPYLETELLSKEVVLKYTRLAYHKFYFRPSFIFKTFSKVSIRTFMSYFLIALQMSSKKFEG